MKNLFLLAVSASAEFLSKEDNRKKCTAVALSGGGSHGAYEAGVLQSLIQSNPKDFEYDVVTGVSAGSINALAVSAFEIGDEVNMVQWISDIWA